MPCNLIRLTTVQLTAAHPTLLKSAVESLGYKVEEVNGCLYCYGHGRSFRIANGEITVGANDLAVVNEVKRAYSKKVVQTAARKYGWNLKRIPGNKVRATKRGL
ncbi:hypothetical protein L0156_15370 [bacterium]|nr:hypothetical protein [bacterium]